MRNTIGTDAACSYVQPCGIGASCRASATAVGPKAASSMPITRSPTARRSTPGPVSTTTPAPSRPIRPASPGYMPRTFSTSRKLTPAARIATRTSPGPSGRRSSGTRAMPSRRP
ncbi:hypothetical protein EAO75_15135 [Streptomyces sp. uw30]|nr:hypothetical protein EAO75_15135 [Streptomyces sp. uw30]